MKNRAPQTRQKSLPVQRRPEAPPAYRPQPKPRVLQTKATKSQPIPVRPQLNSTKPATPQASRPQPQPKVSQPGTTSVRLQTIGSRVFQPERAIIRPVAQRKVVQRFESGVVQAVKIYPNLHPGAVEPVDPGNVFRLNNFANQYRLHKVNSHSVNVPNQQYNFVRTREGEMLLHARYRHPSIAEGKQVLYAGEIFFNNGQLEWWSNGSGHYQPYAEDAEQANLPMDHFFSYQQVIKGEHKRKKG